MAKGGQEILIVGVAIIAAAFAFGMLGKKKNGEDVPTPPTPPITSTAKIKGPSILYAKQ